MALDIPVIILNVILGTFGGLCWILVAKVAWEEAYEWVRRIVLGAIIGFVLYFMDVLALNDAQSAIAVFSLGYLSIEFLTSLELKGVIPAGGA